MTVRFAVLVPARLKSSRLPRKVLLAESGKPLVQHVAERAAAAPGSPRVIVCTDSDEVAEAEWELLAVALQRSHATAVVR